MKTLRIFTMFALSCALLSCGKEKDGDISQLSSPKVIQDEAKTTKTSVAAFWTEVAGAASYNVIFDDRDGSGNSNSLSLQDYKSERSYRHRQIRLALSFQNSVCQSGTT